MPRLSELGDVLVECRVLTRSQWDQAVKIGADDLLTILDILRDAPPHWWDHTPPQPHGLTVYQREVIELRFAADELEQLRRDLALNQFLLLGTLGRGGQGEVQRARQLNPPRYAAVKTLTRDTDLRRRRFEQEARTMMKIHHPSVARFFLYERVRNAAGEPTDEYLIAMEFVNGIDLNRLVRKIGRIPWSFAAHWIAELLDGLAEIHRHGFIHRDVKPENVMMVGSVPGPDVTPGMTSAKLLDFGAVKRSDDDVEEGVQSKKVFVGTPEYAPPEQWAGKLVAASDVYALGGTLFYMLTARYPYQKSKRDAMAYRNSHVGDPVLDLLDYNSDVPEELNRLFQRMMAKDAEERGTAAELRDEFRRLVPVERKPQTTPRLRTVAAAKPKAAPSVSTLTRPPLARNESVAHQPLYRAIDPVLAFVERLFIPSRLRPPRGSEPPLQDRLAALFRRPLVLLIMAAVLILLLYLILWRR